jgi:hypothetical protein
LTIINNIPLKVNIKNELLRTEDKAIHPRPHWARLSGLIVGKMSNKEVLEEIKFIDEAISHNKYLDAFNNKVENALFVNVVVTLGFIVVAGLLVALFLMAVCITSDGFSSLFMDYKNNLSLGVLFSTAFSIVSVPACVLFYKEERNRKNNVKDFMNHKVKILEKFNDFSSEKEGDFVDGFDNYVRGKINAFESDIEKVDLSLKAIKDNDEEFSKYVKTIMSITERVTSERARKIKYRVEASRRLCEPEEEQEKLLKIVEN